MSRRERREADLFLRDLLGAPPGIATLPEHYRTGYGYAQQAELILGEEELGALTLDLLSVRDEEELAEFIGGLAKAVQSAARQAGKVASDVGKVASDVGKAVPALGTVAKLASYSPMGALARSTYGAMSAALRGQNIFKGALDGLAGSPVMAALLKVGTAAIKGENLLAAAKMAVKAGISDAREALRFAAMVAPFVPGIGTGIGAALGAADALASGKPITDAMVAGVRGAIPGGMVAQAAFDTAVGLARGKSLDQAALAAARNQLPAGPAQAAFDTALALSRGKKLQDAVLAGGASLLPASPYTADVMAFAQKALSGQNLGQAALSVAGNAVLSRVQQQGGDLLGTVQGRVAAAIGVPAAAPAAAAVPPAPGAAPAAAQPARPAPRPAGLEQAISAAGTFDRRQAERFLTTLLGRGAQPAPPPAL